MVIPNVMPEEEFARLTCALAENEWPVRQMVQGDAVTRRTAVSREVLGKLPPLRKLLGQGWLKAAFRYVSSFDVEPLFYIQSISRRPKGGADPQRVLHADTFHPALKAWLFLTDVKAGEGAFTYVRGSHRLTPGRLAWEHARALAMPECDDRMTRRGSFRIEREELAAIGLPEPEQIACRANTLVIADTFGFHARGPSGADLNRVEIWAYSRRNPFLPWLGGDIFSLPFLAPRRMEWIWRLRDRFPYALRQTWHKVADQRFILGSGH